MCKKLVSMTLKEENINLLDEIKAISSLSRSSANDMMLDIIRYQVDKDELLMYALAYSPEDARLKKEI